jgi:hypothetical protein
MTDTDAQAQAADGLHQQIEGLLGQERAALARVDTAHLRKVAAGLPDGPTFRFDSTWLSALPAIEGGGPWRCLTMALYFEARGEGIDGQIAVAEVVLNRVEASNFPDTICGVVNEGSHRRNACQFSCACDGRSEAMANRSAAETAGKIARLMTMGAPRRLTGGATHFHATAVRPAWSRVCERTAVIGRHAFYRMPTRIAST